MNNTNVSRPLPLKDIRITDDFWKKEMDLVRKEVIPYQWNALNDNIPDANPSFCMHNFRAAARLNDRRKQDSFVEPEYTFRGFEALPEDKSNPDPDSFYGFVFQDTDFSKWIEAVGYVLSSHPDSELERIADEAIELVCSAQQDDGYLDTYYIINGRDKQFTNLRDHHELYCFGHFVEGAVSYYEATGKDRILNAAKRFADYICKMFGPGPGQIKGYPGHEIAEMALVRLYETTKDGKYLDLARYFIDERGQRPYYFDKEYHPDVKITGHEEEERYQYQQSHKPVREQNEAVGHAVRAVYLYSGMADIARITGDEELYSACQKLWDNIVNQKMYITGGIGATHIGEAFSFNYDLPNDTVYAETCASIGMAFFARRMLEIKPDSKYSDVIEKQMYNGILSGMALDGKSFFYVNPLEVNPEACRKDERKQHIKPVRQKWFGCACCPPNLARFISSIASYAFTQTDNTLYIHQYIGSSLKKDCCGNSVNIEIKSEFPWNGKVVIDIENGCNDFALALRIPGWCNNQYQLSGFDDQVTIVDGYMLLKKDWNEKESITIDFPMTVRLMEADSRVRENIGKVAVTRGPIVYCMEEVDNGKNIHLAKINSGMEKEPDNEQDSGNDFRTEEFVLGDIRANKIIVRGSKMIADNDESGLYHYARVHSFEESDLTFIPYYMWGNRGENEMQVWTRINN